LGVRSVVTPLVISRPFQAC